MNFSLYEFVMNCDCRVFLIVCHELSRKESVIMVIFLTIKSVHGIIRIIGEVAHPIEEFVKQ